MLRLALLISLAAAGYAQPFVYYRGAVNAASFLPPGLPNGAIARGSMFSIFGRALGPTSAQQVSAFPLQTTFAGVAVELTQGTTKVNALPVFVSAGQLNVILPSNTPLGAVSLRTVFNGQTSNPIPIAVTAASIGLFSVNGGGFGPGIVQNFVSQTLQPINSLSSTARPGQTEILWGTGIGAASFSDASAPTAVTLDSSLELWVGGKKATVTYAGRTPCCASIDQIVFTVPADAPSGCYVPVVARSRGVVVSNTVTMAIHPAGAPCTDAHTVLSQARTGGRIAVAQLARETVRVDVNVAQPYEVTLDHLLATFRNSPAGEFYFSALTSPPPPGTCTVYAGGANSFFSSASAFGPPGAQLNPGGPLRVEAGTSSVSAAADPGFAGTFYSLLGFRSPLAPNPQTALLDSGPFSLVGSAFRAALDNVAPMNWINRDQLREIDRSRDQTFSWTPITGSSRGVAITGWSEHTSSDAMGGFVCMAPAGATTFTVPSYVWMALPASDVNSRGPARISLVNVPLTSGAGLAGFDHVFVGMSNWSSRTAVTK